MLEKGYDEAVAKARHARNLDAEDETFFDNTLVRGHIDGGGPSGQFLSEGEDSEEDDQMLSHFAAQALHKPRAAWSSDEAELVRKKDKAKKAPRPRKKRADGEPKSNKKNKGKGKANDAQDHVQDGRVQKKGGKKVTRPNYPTPANGTSLLDVGSLLSANVIRDAQANTGMARLPMLTDTRKAEALKKLVASLPKEHRKAAQTDSNSLHAATRDFTGRGMVRAVPGDGEEEGGWRVSGMKSALKPHQLLGQ